MKAETVWPREPVVSVQNGHAQVQIIAAMILFEIDKDELNLADLTKR